MEKFDFLERGRCRMLSDTINWALYGKIKDLDLATNSGFNSYYGDLFGSGEETFPRHMAHRSIEFQRSNIEINRPHVDAIHHAGMKYIYYSSSCTFDATFFDEAAIKAMRCEFKTDEIAFGTPNRLYGCFNSPAWLDFQVEKCVMLVKELDFDGIFFDNIFYLNPCQCEHCKAKFKRLTGRDLEETVRDISVQDTDEKVHNKGVELCAQTQNSDSEKIKAYLDYYEFRKTSLIEFFEEFRRRVYEKCGKKIALIANTCLYLGEAMDMYKSGIFDAYYTENGYTYAPESNAFSYKVGNAILPEERRSVILVTRVLEGMPTPGMMKVGFAEAMANGNCFTPWGFFIHQSDTLKREVQKYVRFQEKCEFFLTAQNNVAEVVIAVPVRTVVLKKLLGDEAQYMNTGAQIASRMLGDINIPYDIIFADDDFDKSKLAKYKMIIFPETDILSDHNFSVLQELAKEGSTILATGDSFSLNEKLVPRICKLEGENVVLTPLTFDRDYCRVRLTESYQNIRNDTLVQMIEQINPSTMLETSAAPLTILTLTEGNGEYYLHFVNYNTNRGPYSIEVIPDHNIETRVEVNKEISEVVYFTPDDNGEIHRLSFSREGDAVRFTLPRLDYYTVVRMR